MPKPFSEQISDVPLEWVQTVAGFLQRSDLPQAMTDPTSARSASVLIPLYRDGGEWRVLFIRRVANERDHHSGQVAFPGGRRDADDADEVAAALREAHEEIGLETHKIQVIHVLPDYRTSSNYVVTPVVGIVPWPYNYRAQPTEVDRIFSIPLCWLADQNNVELRDRELSRGELSATLKVVYYDRFDGELLWGASARMTVSLLHALHCGDLTLDQF